MAEMRGRSLTTSHRRGHGCGRDVGEGLRGYGRSRRSPAYVLCGFGRVRERACAARALAAVDRGGLAREPVRAAATASLN